MALAPPSALSTTSSTIGRSATTASTASSTPAAMPTSTTNHSHCTSNAYMTLVPSRKPIAPIASTTDTA